MKNFCSLILNNPNSLVYGEDWIGWDEDSSKRSSIYIIHYRQSLLSIVVFFKLHSTIRATCCVDSTVLDYPENILRFNVVYFLLSPLINLRFVFTTWASELKPVKSWISLFPGFNWAEREVWDLFGLFVVKHPDLRRILTDYGFEGYPLRKDFPLSGYIEVKYDENKKRIVTESIELSQEFRTFNFKTPW
jgi:NADH dehydrogenase (ubiquinone) Fe-S protein 3